MTMRTVRLKDVVLGEGPPKVIVPITGTTADEVLAGAEALTPSGASTSSGRPPTSARPSHSPARWPPVWAGGGCWPPSGPPTRAVRRRSAPRTTWLSTRP